MDIKISTATTFFERLFGLIFKSEITVSEILLIPNCKQVHTFFMRYPIDVLFLDADLKILFTEENLMPWRLSKKIPGTVHIAECKTGESEKNFSEFQQALQNKKTYR